MINKTLLIDTLLDAMKDRFPSKSELTTKLVDLLCIEKEAVYRRLRGDVSFSFAEIATISNSFDISLDNIVSSALSYKSRPYQLKMNKLIDPNETDYKMIEEYVYFIKEVIKLEQSTIVDSTNILPIGFYQAYEHIARFYLFKWQYQYGYSEIKPYKKIFFPERLDICRKENVKDLRKIKNTYYIFDPLIFQYIVNDLKYYQTIGLIEDSEIKLLKEEFFRLLEEMNNIAVKGYFEETGCKVHIYLSYVNFDTSYWYIDASPYKVSMIKVFLLNSVASFDLKSFEHLKKRNESLIRSSMMISVSGEKQRMDFFRQQHEIISSL